MAGISLVVVMLLGQAPARDPAELVRQLGSARYDEREAASAALEALGLAALPALRAATGLEDPEVRNRVTAIAAKIERLDLKAATPIRLDVVDQPLDSVIAGFGFPLPGRLAWHPDTPQAVRLRHVTIREPGPLPFWAAIDRLCRAGDLRYIPGSPVGPHGTRRTEFRLYLAPGAWAGPRADSGSLRLEIVGIYHSAQVHLIPNSQRLPTGRSFGPRLPPFGGREEQFHIPLRILAEPRMLMRQVGDALIAEAVDDRGQSLLPGPAPFLYPFGYSIGEVGYACIDYTLNLKYPQRAGTMIKRLKLTIPVGVETRKPGRLEIRLADAVGKTVRHGTTSIQVLAVRDEQGHQVLTLRLSSDAVVLEHLSLTSDGELAPTASRVAPPEITPNVIQVLDQHGHQFPWHIERSKANGPEVTAELMMWPGSADPMPVPTGRGVIPPEERKTAVPAVLYHTEVTHDVILSTFEFHDVPLP
jgi:hypothetical protein